MNYTLEEIGNGIDLRFNPKVLPKSVVDVMKHEEEEDDMILIMNHFFGKSKKDSGSRYASEKWNVNGEWYRLGNDWSFYIDDTECNIELEKVGKPANHYY